MSNRVAATLSFRRKWATFEWSCSQIFRWFNCLCIPLSSAAHYIKTQRSSKCSYELKKSAGILILVLNIGRLLTLIILHFEWFASSSNRSNKTESTRMRSFLINLFNQSIITIGCQLSLIVSTLSQWNSLIAVFHQIEKHKMFNFNKFRRFRRISQWGFLFMLMDVGFCFGSTIVPLCLSNDKTLSMWSVLYYSSRIFNVYPFCTAILFSCLGAIVLEMYEFIALSFNWSSCRQFTASIWKAKLILLKKHCLLVGELVNKINRCFSAFLLIFITCQFCRMITMSFHLMTSVWKHDWITSGGVLLQLLVDFVHFYIVVYTPYCIRQKASALVQKLYRIEIQKELLQYKLDIICEQLSKNLPNFTAMNLFDVDLQLIPTLVGTTLSYLIVLFQFETAEHVN